MTKESCFLSWRSSNIHYFRYGQGPALLFCFHGYGESGESFEPFNEHLGKDYTLIAIDLPFHGKTEWKENTALKIKDLKEIMDLINKDSNPYSLLGYSMGGRISLSLLQTYPEMINKTVVVAPDGLHNNKWQWLSTQTLIGRRLFAYTMKNPGWMFGMMDIATQLGLFNKSIHKFVHHYLDEDAERKRLYLRWNTMSKFIVKKMILSNAIQAKSIPVKMLFGKYDRVILTKHGTAFAKKVPAFITIKELEAGHLLMAKKYIPIICSLIVADN